MIAVLVLLGIGLALFVAAARFVARHEQRMFAAGSPCMCPQCVYKVPYPLPDERERDYWARVGLSPPHREETPSAYWERQAAEGRRLHS